MQQETEKSINLGQYWDAIRRHRRGMFVTFIGLFSLACAAAWLLPAKYRSETTILVEQPKVPEQYVVPNVGSDLQDRLQTLTQQILSRTRLQQIIEDFHLYPEDHGRMASDELIGKMRKDIKVDLIQAPSKPAELTAFKVSYSGSNAQLVQQVTSRLTSLFIEENLRAREQQSENTTEFLDNQLQEARTKLEQQEAQLKQFKAQNVGQLPGELQSNLQILSGLQSRLEQANEGLNRSEQQKLYLTSLLNSYRDTPEMAVGPGGTTNPLDVDAELARLRAQLEEYRSRYTDEHPAVVQLRSQIAKDEKLKAEMEKDAAGSGDTDQSGLPRSRGVAEIQSQLKATELDIQNRNKEIGVVDEQIKAYQARLSNTPLREEQLADLSRDYDQSRANYESLLAKKNQSALATDLEKTQQGEQFAVLDPPSMPAAPYFPNRLLFTLAGVGVGLVAAFASAILREMLDGFVHTGEEIAEISKLPMLVMLPVLATPNDVRRTRWTAVAEIAAGVVVLAIVAASTLVAYYHG